MVQRKMSQKSEKIIEEYIRITGEVWKWRTRQWISEFLETLEKELIKDNSNEWK